MNGQGLAEQRLALNAGSCSGCGAGGVEVRTRLVPRARAWAMIVRHDNNNNNNNDSNNNANNNINDVDDKSSSRLAVS